jgi:hypothetical protein
MKTLMLLVLMVMVGCKTGEIVETGYLVTDTHENLTTVLRYNSMDEVHSMVYETLGTWIDLETLMRGDKPFVEIRTSEHLIYIEKKGIDERGHWKMYDVKLVKIKES